MFNRRKKITKFKNKFFGILSIGVLLAGSVTGITFASIDTVNKIKLNSDFSHGRSIQFNLNLVDENNKTFLDINQRIKPEELTKVMDMISNSAKTLVNHLKELGLTNIDVSSGTAIKNDLEVGVVNLTFENSESSLSLDDIKEEVNDLYNNFQIKNNIIESNNFTLELVKDHYSGVPALTGRQNDSQNTLLVDKDNQVILDSNYYDVNAPINMEEKASLYTDKKGNQNDQQLQVVGKNKYNSGIFVEDQNEFEQIVTPTPTAFREEPPIETPPGETPPEDTPVNPEETKYQTAHTWIMWNGKVNLVNHMNDMILAAKYNQYTNNLYNYADINTFATFDDIPVGQDINATSDNEVNTYYINTTVEGSGQLLKDQINNYLFKLTSTDIKFIRYATTSRQPLVTEENLLTTLYDYFNYVYRGVYIFPDSEQSINDINGSNSVRNGWGFLESDNFKYSDEIWADYMYTRIDRRNYTSYFLNEEEKDKNSQEPPSDETPVFYTNKILVPDAKEKDVPKLVRRFNDGRLALPIGNFDLLSSLENIKISENTITSNNPKFPSFSNDNATWILKTKEIQDVFANTDSLLNLQNNSRPKFVRNYINLSPVIVLIIALAVTIFIIGIFISIRYRLAGFLGLIGSFLTLAISLLLFSVFGFQFSFFSYIAITFVCFLSFLTPFFFYKNVRKEISDGSNVKGSVIKTCRKYWKLTLDVYIAMFLISASFLFFGKLQNVDFGAMLMIGTFLSALFSGILFYLFVLFVTIVLGNDENFFFISNHKYVRLVSIYNFSLKNIEVEKRKLWYKNISSKNIFSKASLISFAGFAIILIISIAVFCTSGTNGLFNSGNQEIIINNFDQVTQLSAKAFVNQLHINNFSYYLYDNQLIINSISGYNIQNIVDLINTNFSSSNQIGSIINNTSVNNVATFISNELVINTLSCIGIGIGFLALWCIVSLNVVSVLPIAIIQTLAILISLIVISITRIVFDIDSVAILNIVYITTAVYATSIISCLKRSWNRGLKTTKTELKNIINSIINKISINFTKLTSVLIVFALISIFIDPNVLLWSFLLLIMDMIIINLFLTRMLIILFYGCILIRNNYLKEFTKSIQAKNIDNFNYDLVDEQNVNGINS